MSKVCIVRVTKVEWYAVEVDQDNELEAEEEAEELVADHEIDFQDIVTIEVCDSWDEVDTSDIPKQNVWRLG